MEKREVILDRLYEKGTERVIIFVARLSGGEIEGTMFQFEEWLNNQELTDMRLASGDKYAVHQRFQNRLGDLVEDGWRKMGGFSGGQPDQRFFDPSPL